MTALLADQTLHIIHSLLIALGWGIQRIYSDAHLFKSTDKNQWAVYFAVFPLKDVTQVVYVWEIQYNIEPQIQHYASISSSLLG